MLRLTHIIFDMDASLSKRINRRLAFDSSRNARCIP